MLTCTTTAKIYESRARSLLRASFAVVSFCHLLSELRCASEAMDHTRTRGEPQTMHQLSTTVFLRDVVVLVYFFLNAPTVEGVKPAGWSGGGYAHGGRDAEVAVSITVFTHILNSTG